MTVQAPDYGFNPYSKELKGQYTQNQLDYLNMIALKKRQQAQIAACNKAKTAYESVLGAYGPWDVNGLRSKYSSACKVPLLETIDFNDK